MGRVDGIDAALIAGPFGGSGCGWYTAVPEALLPSAVAVFRSPWTGALAASLDGRRIILDRASADAEEARFDTDIPTGWSRGGAGTIRMGVEEARRSWTAAVLGPLPAATFALDGHELTTRASTSWSSVDIVLASPARLEVASEVLSDSFWLLRLAEPRPFSRVALWDAGDREGTTSFDSNDRSIRHRLLDSNHVPTYLDAAAAHWSALDPYERRVLSVIIDMLLVACESNIETSIAVSASAIELASEEWLPASRSQHPVPRSARKAIRADLVASAQRHAAGTEFATNSKEIAGRLFNRTTKERFKELLVHLGIPADDDGIDEFVNMRNRVVHGGFQKEDRSDRVRAFLFGRWLLSTCILRQVGYRGPAADWRRLHVG